MWREINPDQLDQIGDIMPRRAPSVTAEHSQEASSYHTMDGREWVTSDEIEVRVTCTVDRIGPATEQLHRAVADVERQLSQVDQRVLVAGQDGAQDSTARSYPDLKEMSLRAQWAAHRQGLAPEPEEGAQDE